MRGPGETRADSGIRLLLTTFPDEETGGAIVRRLLGERLIACATLLPNVRSLYWWEGKIEETSEIAVLMKTATGSAGVCMARLQELHPYEVPEIVLLDPEEVSAPYASWIREALRIST